MKFRSAIAVLAMSVAVTACGELPFQKTTGEPEATGHSGPPGVSPLEQPIETGAESVAVATAEASTMNTAMFRAAGSGWTVTASDSRAVYERSGAKSTAVSVRRVTYARGVEFIGTMNGSVFSLNVQAAECKTGDGSTPFTAKLRVGSQRLTGCAAPTTTMPKAQVTASSAAPKPKSTPKPAAVAPAAKPAETAAPASTEATPAPAVEPATTSTTTTAPPAASVSPAPAETTPAPVVSETPETPAAAAPSTTSGVPAPEMVLPPTPPAATE
ncbi:hypothetical protein RGQ15_00445 [Paracoccus sp. MBLB3053]|uniref:Uncharacterized protein n=1 Tax=Paracoccus aurantius TaxID=3073814 RepID=A0ABU2HLY1_9RHOB|nr:hypothetical protein [Paracoccus sp. MBLB3053]MDS9466045.1 hypothetical protein [Paracoccus sp. MBLB3053]